MIQRIIDSPVGPLKITIEHDFVTGLDFLNEHSKKRSSKNTPCAENNPTQEESLVFERTLKELSAYFRRELQVFTIPVKLSGTPFQQKVWNAMKEIGYGKTKTYGELAKAAGAPKAVRAVGTACGANPVAIIVPCHRVLAQNGLGGFGGGLPTKCLLLSIEDNKRGQ